MENNKEEKYQIAPYKFEFEVDPVFRNNIAFTLSYIIASDYIYENGMTKSGSGVEKGSISLPLGVVDTDGNLKPLEEVALYSQSEQVRQYMILINQLFVELRNASQKILEEKVEPYILNKDLPEQES